MDRALSLAMIDMSVEKDTPIELQEEGEFSSMTQSARSLIGRLLNPDCQNMARMLQTMLKIWKIYKRVRGIALTRESFQFFFEHETDLQTVMRYGFWNFDDWCVVMDRWVENPPTNFLKEALG